MTNFFSNLAAYKLIDEYYITTKEGTMVTIRVLQSIIGAQEFSYKASPYFPLLDNLASPKFQGFGPTPNDAFQNCLKAIDGISIVELVRSATIQR